MMKKWQLAAAESQFDTLFGNSNDFDSNISHHDHMAGTVMVLLMIITTAV